MKSQEIVPENRQTVKLVTRGRRSGLPHIVLTRYVVIEGSFYVLGGKTSSDWVMNIRASGTAKLRLGEYVYEVSAKPVLGEELSRVNAAFAKKYGERTYRQWYATSEVCLKLTPESPPQTRGVIIGELDSRTDFRQWKTQNVNYYDRVSTAFDSASEEYDFTISQNYINRWIRRRSIAELLRITLPSDVLLEIGCGTGAEAVEISKRVTKIVATDISDRMIEQLRLKVEARGLSHRLVPLKCRAKEISKVASSLPGGRARIAYSFNGALNCEPGIEEFPAELANVLEDGGYFLCSVRNTFCLSEALSHAVALQFGKMAPRKKQPIVVSVGGMDVPSTYYSPAAFVKLFSPLYDVRRMVGLPAVLPPAYLSDYYLKLGGTRRVVERIEAALGDRFPMNRFGDQTLFVFRKKGGIESTEKFGRGHA